MKNIENDSLENDNEGREILINLDEVDKNNCDLETSLEIKYKTSFLNYFPIKYRNFSRNLTFKAVSTIANKIAIEFLPGDFKTVGVKLYDYDKFRMIEFKHREFRFALGCTDASTFLLNTNDFFEYEISKELNNIRLREIINFFKNIFSASPIKFSCGKYMVDLSIYNPISVFKFDIIENLLDKYENLIKNNVILNKNKNFSSFENTFYDFHLLSLYYENPDVEIDAWINCDIADSKLKSGDKLTLIRKHHFKSFILDEEIHLNSPIYPGEINEGKFSAKRRTAKINLKKSDI